MFRWVQTLLLVGVAALSLPAAAVAKPVAGQARIAINWEAHNADFSRTAERDDVVVLHEWEKDRLRALKAANPRITVLMIKNLSSMTAAEFGNAGTGISTQQAADHPEWYLLNTSGKRFTFNDYDYLWAADIGDRDYQVRWAANVAAKLKADPWDGVLVDDANPTMEYHYPVSAVAKYPTDEAYQRATGSALALIGPRLRAQGKLVVANFGSWRVFRSAVTPWLKYVSGGMEEHFTKYGESPGEGYFTDTDWDNLLGLLKETQATGKLFLGISHSNRTDRAAARYGWATMLLAANGSASFALHEDYTRETWFPEYGYDLGAPRGKESELDGGIHRRAFERGLVLVNPTKASVAVRFGGRYRGSGLRAARSDRDAPAHGPRAARRQSEALARGEQQAPPPPRRPSLSARSRRLPSSRPPVPAGDHRRGPLTGPAPRGRSPPRQAASHRPCARPHQRQGPCGTQARTPPQDRHPRAPLSSRYSPS